MDHTWKHQYQRVITFVGNDSLLVFSCDIYPRSKIMLA